MRRQTAAPSTPEETVFEFTGALTPQAGDKPILIVFDGWGYTPLEPTPAAIKTADQEPLPDDADSPPNPF